jgi:phospholipid/cholesterol/gamma-HCH transport system substrate-binding protein
MQKAAPTVGRVLTMVGFALSCFGLLLFLWLAFGGAIPLAPKGYRFNIEFPEATQLAKEADVRISGVPVGKVKDLKPDPKTGLTKATIELTDRYAPIPHDARAILRQKTLLGETYVELTPGTHRVGDKRYGLKENGTLPEAQVAPTVQLDEIFRAFNAKTRQAYRDWMQRQAVALNGRGEDLNNALGNLAPTVEDTNALLQVLNTHEASVHRIVRNTGEVFAALTARDHQLASLINNSNRVFSTTAKQNEALKQIFEIFPTFNNESRLTFNALSGYAKNTNPLVTQLRPAARQLSPTLQQLSLLSPDLKALFRDLGPLIKVSRAGLPATRAFLNNSRPLLAQLDPDLRNLNPILSYVALYKKELSAFFANTVATTQATDSVVDSHGNPLHYLRTTNPVNPENLAVYPARLASNRPNPYTLPGAFSKLNSGLQVFENRQCAGGLSVLPPTPGKGGIPAVVDAATTLLLQNITQFYFVNGKVPLAAPACRLQQPLGRALGHGTGDYPHVLVTPPSK